VLRDPRAPANRSSLHGPLRASTLGTPPATDPLGGVSLNTVQSTPGGVWDTYEIVGNDNEAAPLSLVLGNS
jgi:hypothetical protein